MRCASRAPDLRSGLPCRGGVSRRPRRWLAGTLLLVGATACGRPVGGGPGIPTIQSIFDPASPAAEQLAGLTWLLHAIMAIIFAGVLTALLWIARRYRARSDDERGRLIFGNTRLEIAWTTAPALTVLVVFLISLNVMCSVDPPGREAAAGDGGEVRVVAIGRQWWWEYRLPDYNVVAANELHLPAGRRAEIELRSDDVLHNWWVPQLQGKRYNIPGQVNHLSFTPTTAGIFGGACGEFCGVQHAWMRTMVVVEPPEQFEAWALRQAQPARIPERGLAAEGAQLFRQLTCQSCHTIDGYLQATANAGPNLTHMASRAIIAAGVLENTPENMAFWLANPQEVKPGNLMPNFELSPEEVAALTAFMESLE